MALAAIVVLAAACGDESGGDSSTAAAQAPAGGGSGGSGSGGSISISGTPPAQVMQGTPFSFSPTVSNPNGVSLTFTASNLPGWASINASTGRITGTPGAADVGVWSNIRVTVAGGGQSFTSPAYSITVVSAATGSATLSWMPPTQKTDGTPLGSSLAGYRIYYGQSQNNLNRSVTINSPGITTYVVDNLTAATWYFAATAYDTSGAESAFSNIGSKTIL